MLVAASAAWAAEAALETLPAAPEIASVRWTAERSSALIPAPAQSSASVRFNLVSSPMRDSSGSAATMYAPAATVLSARVGPGQRPPSGMDPLVELHWRLGERRSAVPVLEVGGCDLVSPEQVRALRAGAADARGVGTRSRRAVAAAIVGFLKTGCQ